MVVLPRSLRYRRCLQWRRRCCAVAVLEWRYRCCAATRCCAAAYGGGAACSGGAAEAVMRHGLRRHGAALQC